MKRSRKPRRDETGPGAATEPQTPVAAPEPSEPFEADPEERRTTEPLDTDIAPDRLDTAMPEPRTADAETCSLPDEPAADAGDVG